MWMSGISFFFKQKTAYEIGLGIPAEPLFRSNQNVKKRPACSELRWAYCNHKATNFASYLTGGDCVPDDQNRGNATCRKGPHKGHRLGMKNAISFTILKPPKILIAGGRGILRPSTLRRHDHTTNI